MACQTRCLDGMTIMEEVFDYAWKAVMESTISRLDIIEWHANEIIDLKKKILEQIDFLNRKIWSSKEKAN